MLTCMDVSLKNVCTCNFNITYTAYHLWSEKQTIPLRSDFKHAPFKSIPHLNILTVPNWLAV